MHFRFHCYRTPKNFSLASGFLLIVAGLDGHAWHSFVADPLASLHPYATAALPR